MWEAEQLSRAGQSSLGIVAAMAVLASAGCGSLGKSYEAWVGSKKDGATSSQTKTTDVTPSKTKNTDGTTSRTKKISGVPYSLPKVLLTATLVRDSQGVAVEIGTPTFTADSSATYLLSYAPSASSKDKFNIGVDPNTSLLTSVGGEAEDQTGQALVAVAKAVGALGKAELAEETGRQVLYQGAFDPNDPEDRGIIDAALRDALQGEVKSAVASECATAKSEAERASTANSKKTANVQLSTTIASCDLKNKWPDTARLTVNVSYQPFIYKDGVNPESCEIGFCTRVSLPARIAVKSGGRELASQTFNMPNGSMAVPVRLNRAAFVKSTHAITLSNGLVGSSEVTKESELLAIANLPFDILKAIFAAPAELIQLKVNLTNADKALLEAEKGKLEAEKARLEAEKALADVRAGKREAGLISNGTSSASSSGLLLRIAVPGLGPGSGAELKVTASGIPEGSGASTTGSQSSDASKTKTTTTETKPDFGPNVTSGSDGDKKKQ